MATFAGKGGVFEERRVYVGQWEEEEEWTICIPGEDRRIPGREKE